MSWLYNHGVTEIGEVYKVREDGTLTFIFIGDPNRFYWWEGLDLFAIIVISILGAIVFKFLINAMIKNKNKK